MITLWLNLNKEPHKILLSEQPICLPNGLLMPPQSLLNDGLAWNCQSSKEKSMTEFIRQITPPNSPPNKNDHDPTAISVHKVKVILYQAVVRFFWDFWEPENCEKLPLRCVERASQRCQSLKISRFALLRGDFLRNYSYNGGPGAPSEL